jgi:hypothetical protein
VIFFLENAGSLEEAGVFYRVKLHPIFALYEVIAANGAQLYQDKIQASQRQLHKESGGKGI